MKHATDLPKPQIPQVETIINCPFSKSHNHWLNKPVKWFEKPDKNSIVL